MKIERRKQREIKGKKSKKLSAKRNIRRNLPEKQAI